MKLFVTSLQINFCKNRNTNIKLLLFFFINILQNSLQTLLSIRKKFTEFNLAIKKLIKEKQTTLHFYAVLGRYADVLARFS